MKQSINLLLFLFSTASVFAQDALQLPGAIFIGGTFTRLSTSQKAENNATTSNSTYGYNPAFGYLITPNFGVGVSANFFRLKETSSTNNLRERNLNSWSAGPMVRNYLPILKFFGVFAESCIGFGATENKTVLANASFNSTVKSSLFNMGISPGAYLLLRKVSLDLRIGGWQYARTKTKDVTGGNTTNITRATTQQSSLLLSLQNIQVGATLFFGQKIAPKS